MKRPIIILFVFSTLLLINAMGMMPNTDLPWNSENLFNSDAHYTGKIISTNNNKTSIMEIEVWNSKQGIYKMRFLNQKNQFLKNLTVIVKNNKSILINSQKKAYVIVENNNVENQDNYPIYSNKKEENDWVIKKEFIKNEKVGNFNCKKYKVITYKKSEPNKKQTYFVWVWNKKNIPIKFYVEDKENNSSITYVITSLSLKKLSPSTFIPPKNYKKFDNYGEYWLYNPNKKSNTNKGEQKNSLNNLMEKLKQMQDSN